MSKHEENALVPKLRFAEFRTDGTWKIYQLGQCLSRHPEYGINAPAVPYSENLPRYLRITDISEDGEIRQFQKVSVAKNVTNENYLDKGDIVLARTGASVGKAYKYRERDGRLVFAGFLIRIKPDNKKINSELLFQFLSTEQYWRWISLTSARSGQPGVNGNEFSLLPIPLPSTLKEQKKIADCLTSIDELITTQTKKFDTLKTHKKGLMQQLFPGVGKTVPELRFSQFRGAKEWVPTTVGQIADFKSGGTPSKGNLAFWNGSIPWASAKDMKQLFLDDTEDHITTAAVEAGAKPAPAGTILMLTRGMTLLKDVPICILNRQMSYNQDVKALQPKSGFDARFLAYLLLGCKQQLLNLVDIAGHGTGRLDTDKLKAFEVMLPQIAEQRCIADCLSSLEDLLSAQRQKINILKAHKKGLVQQLFPTMSEVSA